MGFYINPKDSTKETWLKKWGLLIADQEIIDSIFPGFHLVCLVDNGAFTAAGIAFNEREREAFTSGLNGRAHWWFLVADGDLIAVCPEVEGALA